MLQEKWVKMINKQKCPSPVAERMDDCDDEGGITNSRFTCPEMGMNEVSICTPCIHVRAFFTKLNQTLHLVHCSHMVNVNGKYGSLPG